MPKRLKISFQKMQGMFVDSVYVYLCLGPFAAVILYFCRKKDDIRESGGVRCLCRLLGVSKSEAVQEYIVITLAFLATQNDLYVHDNFRFLIILKIVTKVYANFFCVSRNWEEIRREGGLKILCDLLSKVPLVY